jgi:hypothetical protein
MAILADRGPFFENGGPQDDPTWATKDRLAANVQKGAEIKLDKVNENATDILRADNDKWKPYNSRNHAQEGENVMFHDSHVEFQKKPIVGPNGDNIYTWQSAYTMEKTLLGRVPDDKRGPWTQTDAVLVP